MSRNPDPPRLELARLPTPLEHLASLSQELGCEIYVKRDDLTGLELTGNKVRKLEYVLARALIEEADVILTCGGAQSNHARATAAAARRMGLDVEVFLRGAGSAPSDGNLLLIQVLGARIHSLTPDQYRHRSDLMAERAEELGAAGRRAFVIPEGASTPLGAMGYVRCVEELVEQAGDAGIEPELVVSAVGSGGTFAGLLAGAAVHGFDGRMLGVPVCDDAAYFQGIVQQILDGMVEEGFLAARVEVPAGGLLDGFVGPGYGIATTADLERLRDLAVLTGMFLDPVYTNKAFGALLAMIRHGTVPAGSQIVFLHTGGLFGLLPYREQIKSLVER